MRALDAILEALPESAKDIKLNVQAVLTEGSLTAAQRWGVAVASAAAARNRALRDAVRIAATIHAAAVALESAGVAASA